VKSSAIGDRTFAIAVGTVDGFEARHHESGVGRQVDALNARHDLVAQRRLEVRSVRVDQRASPPDVALALDPLPPRQQAADAVMGSRDVADDVEGLAVAPGVPAPRACAS